jgi:hypothetical protein
MTLKQATIKGAAARLAAKERTCCLALADTGRFTSTALGRFSSVHDEIGFYQSAGRDLGELSACTFGKVILRVDSYFNWVFRASCVVASRASLGLYRN